MCYNFIVGDKITFAGSDWYVIENSDKEQGYVSLLKEKILSNEELGDYAWYSTCTADDVEYGWTDGCTFEGEVINNPNGAMAFYWSDTCHRHDEYGYSESDDSGCDGHNDYAGSKVKEMLENHYMPTLGKDNLIEKNGYKIRLFTVNELQTNFGYGEVLDDDYHGSYILPTEKTPEWIYSGFSEKDNFSYWTMTNYDKYFLPQIWEVTSYQGYFSKEISPTNLFYDRGVRPIINLKKSAIR